MLRPHGHLLRTGDHLTPDEASLTTTVWMAGVFNALLTQGHVSINRLLSTTRSYLSLQRAHGQRIFVEQDDGYALLDVPSAWEVSPSACRWLYAHAGGLIEVRVTAPTTRHAIELEIAILEGPPCALPAVQPRCAQRRRRCRGRTGPLQARRHRDRPAADPRHRRRPPLPRRCLSPGSAGRHHHRSGEPGRGAVRRQALTPAAVRDGGHRPGDARWISFHRRVGRARPRPRRQALTTRRPRPGSGRRWPGRSR